MDEDTDFIPFSKDTWRAVVVDDDIVRSGGVSSKKFHRNPMKTTCNHAGTDIDIDIDVNAPGEYSKSMEETRKILRQAEMRVDYLGKKRKFDDMNEIS